MAGHKLKEIRQNSAKAPAEDEAQVVGRLEGTYFANCLSRNFGQHAREIGKWETRFPQLGEQCGGLCQHEWCFFVRTDAVSVPSRAILASSCQIMVGLFRLTRSVPNRIPGT